MVSHSKSRARPATDEAHVAPPPAKRRKPSPAPASNGLANILLNSKSGKKLAPVYTSKGKHSNVSKVSDKDAVIGIANGHGDVENSASKKSVMIEISSDESSSDEGDEEDGDVEMDGQINGVTNGVQHVAGSNPSLNASKSSREDEQGGEEEGEEEDEEPTFGERLQGHGAGPIDVEAALANMDESSDETQKPKSRDLAIPSAATFGTVLSQALRTNDKDLLESCFETNDLEGVRETISRLDSRYIVTLLKRIAERISKSPGRLGNLMVWVQWSIIAHGGYLAGQPDVVSQMGSLIRVIKERANGLQPLLQLKGKLDMLSAQLDLRRDIQDQNAGQDSDDEGAVTVYYEGQEDEDSADEEDDSDNDEPSGKRKAIGAFTNGIVKGDLSDESDSSDGDEALFDDEAEETDDDEEASDEEDEESNDEDSD